MNGSVFGPRTRIGRTALALWLAAVPTVLAQSAADKATARQTAKEGISLFDDGDYEGALDRLNRAQALYDAPVHLLYIARAQTKLGQFVEAAENYQLLVRYDLEANAPAAFTAAVESGKQELQALEPRISSLQINVSPADLESLEVTVDERPISSAAIGLNRPINPGQHTIVAKAPGYKAAQATVTLQEGKKEEVLLELEADLSASATTGSSASVDGRAAGSGDGRNGAPKRGLIGFLAGVRLAAAIPGGKTFSGARDSATFGVNATDDVTDFFGPGIGGELRLGVRIAQYFTPLVFLEGYFLQAGEVQPGTAITFENVASARSVGVGVMVGSAPDEIGGFGEFGIAVDQSFVLNSKIVDRACSIDRSLSGVAFRVGGGAFLPVSSFLNLTAFGAISFGRFNQFSTSSSGNACTGVGVPKRDLNIPSEQQDTHTLLTLGVGGDFVFGRDLR